VNPTVQLRSRTRSVPQIDSPPQRRRLETPCSKVEREIHNGRESPFGFADQQRAVAQRGGKRHLQLGAVLPCATHPRHSPEQESTLRRGAAPVPLPVRSHRRPRWPMPERFWKARLFQYTDVKKIEEILVNLATGTDTGHRNETICSIEA
jgi:hypothetical protein